MKKVLLLVCLVAGFGLAKAQEEASFTDEELTKYATVMVWAEAEKEQMTETYNDWINNDETLEAARFVKIKSAKGDSVKLQEIEVTEEELVAFEQIQANYDSMTASFKEVYVGKIKEDIGAGLYNRLRKAMRGNADLKARYQAVYDGLKEEQSAAKEDDETEE
ncbi:hypothetical protein [Ekhidna sp.]|uniref:hypothetical protein n=1 Tax=Ekhidna sp. TaxID=2608089 RepID=UPI003C7DDF98